MKLSSVILSALTLAGAAFGSECNKDIKCLTEKAQITFIGQVVSKDTTNTKFFSADVKPLCNLYGSAGAIEQAEYSRTIHIGGFGSHAGGTCDAEIGNVGDIDIFFVHVNNTVAKGGVRNFGLYDPCWGAFPNTTDNYVEISKYIFTELKTTPTGVQCPVISEDANSIYVDGIPYNKTINLNLDSSGSTKVNLEDAGSGAAKNLVMASSAFVVLTTLLQFLL